MPATSTSHASLILAVTGAALALLIAGCGPILDLGADEPLAFVEQPRTSHIVTSEGVVLADLHGVEDRDEVDLDTVAPELTAAVVAIEDRRFFAHRGVDVPAIARAVVRNVGSGEVEQGGSTLTQQLVKTTMTGPARTFDRKLEEALLAVRLEQSHDKPEILERYLNTVYFGRGAYGVAAAARRFFDVEPDELALDQAALLAGMIASPSGFDPWDAPERATARREQVLAAMVATGQIDRLAAETAGRAPLNLADSATASDDQAPWVAAEVRRRLQHDPHGRFAEALGSSLDERVDALFTGGLRIVTTVDLPTQLAAETTVSQRLGTDGPAGALVTLDPGTGAIRALVGGHAADAAVGFNVVTQGRRSPGSAFKPVALAAALQRGIELDRTFPGGACVVIDDVPGWEEDPGACNYRGTSHGPLTLREATVRSANTVYARLAEELGPEALVAAARQLGIDGELAEVHALALGGPAVRPLELAAAYGVFATLGELAEPYLVERIEDADGTVLYEHRPRPDRVLDEQVAWSVTDTLTDVVRRGTGVRATIERPQAGKTGTSQDNADAWFVGYTPELVTAVWVGFPEGSVPLRPPAVEQVIEGGREPAQMWAEVMRVALRDRPTVDFPEPEVALVEVEVDVSRGCLPNPYTPSELVEMRRFPRGSAPTARCTEPTGPRRADVPQLVGLPLEVAERLLDERGYDLEVRREHSPLQPPGVVTRQRPRAGEELATAEPAVLWSSVTSATRGSPPDVLGEPLEDAVALLEDDGWVVEVRTACPCSQPPGTVHTQRPAGGIETPEHAVVVVTIVPGTNAPPDAGSDGRR